MTGFVHTHYPQEHPGLARVEHAASAWKKVAGKFDSNRGLAALLLAAVVSALLVVANQVMDTWSDGHLLAGWIALWLIAFAGLAVLATPAHRVSCSLRAGLKAYRVRRKQAIADEQLWNIALVDARVMADISRAMAQDGARDVRSYS
jgi:hypothetical protein